MPYLVLLTPELMSSNYYLKNIKSILTPELMSSDYHLKQAFFILTIFSKCYL